MVKVTRLAILRYHLTSESVTQLLSSQDVQNTLRTATDGFTPADLKDVSKKLKMEAATSMVCETYLKNKHNIIYFFH